MSQTKVKAGEGYVEIGLRNRIAEGARGVQDDLNKLSQKTLALGASLAAASAGLLVAPIKSAARLEDTIDKFDVVFGESSQEMQKWARVTGESMSVPQESMLGMLSGMQDLLVPMGVLPERASRMSQTLTSLSADLASFNGLQTSDVFNDMMAAMTGSGEVMKKYGVILSEAAVKQELLSMGMDPKSADNQAKAIARLNIMVRGTTAAHGDAERTAGSFSGRMRALVSVLSDATGIIGGALIDDMSALLSVTVSGVTALRDFTKENKDLVRTLGLATLAAGGLGAGLIATGVAAKIAASAIGAVMMASQVAASGAALAWGAVSLAFTVITLKSRITAAVVQTAWSVAAKGIGIAWEATTKLLGLAMQGLTAVVTAGAVAAPWIAGAALIAVAWLGLDTTLGLAAAGVSAAWSASAGAITAAWTAASAYLAGLGISTAAVWAAAPATIGAAWTALKAVLVSTGAAGAASAFITKAAWAAVAGVQAVIAGQATVSALIAGTAWKVAGVVSSVAWGGFVAVLTAALTPASLMAGAAFVASSAWTVGAAAASAAWSTAWAVITGPIAPFLALGAIAAAVVATAAVKALDFGNAMGKAKEMIGGVVSVVTDVFDTLQVALGAGNYAAAAEALWAGIRLAFWEGVGGAMSAFSWLWDEAKAMTGRFFSELLSTTWRVMKAVATALMNPFGAAKEIGQAIADLASSATSFDVGSRADAARSELKTMRDLLSADAERNKNAQAAKRIMEETLSAKQRMIDKIKEINELERAGSLTPEQANEARSKAQETFKASTANEPKAKTNDRDVFGDKVKALELEILALEKGETAAERKRLADEGLNKAQIAHIELLKRKKQAIEEAAEAEKTASQKRVDQVFRRGDELANAGMAPDEVFKQVMTQIQFDEESGNIDKETAGEARDTARSNLDDRMDALKREGQALAEALRTPAEVLSSKLREISQLQDAGAIDEKTALRAEDKARTDFMRDQERGMETSKEMDSRMSEEQQRTGPNATFSAVGAMIIGAGSNPRDEELKVARETAQNTSIIAKQSKKNTTARFA